MYVEPELVDRDIYLAADHNLTDEMIEACYQVSEIFTHRAYENRMAVLAETRELHPEIEAASALGSVAAFSSVLEHLRKILLEGYEENPDIQDELLKLSATIAAHGTVCELMYDVFLSITDISRTILNDENAPGIADAADRVVQSYGYTPLPAQDIQLELPLDD